MTPSKAAKDVALITLAKSKMVEFNVHHSNAKPLPVGLDLDDQFPLALGIIGDFAAQSNRWALTSRPAKNPISKHDLIFAAQVLQAYQECNKASEISTEILLLAASAYFLADLPGRSLVLTRKISWHRVPNQDFLLRGIRALLERPWEPVPATLGENLVRELCISMHSLYHGATRSQDIAETCAKIIDFAYSQANDHNLLFADIICAVALKRSAKSAFTLLPQFSSAPEEVWSSYLARTDSIKDLWPSQDSLGLSGVYSGRSAVIQMPTSAGKTRAVEVIIRSAFMSGRANFAIVIAPFRALCQEISLELTRSFSNDSYLINQLSDTVQEDYNLEVVELLKSNYESTPRVLIATPEKFLYLLRREPSLAENIGLIIYDEGHQFDSGVRGVTYELLLTSIRRMTPPEAQVVLISAVIENPHEIATWLLHDPSKVIIDKNLQSRRLVAFTDANSRDGLTLWFRNDENNDEYFDIPIFLTQPKISARGRETVPRHFPEYNGQSIALYLASTQASEGASAIYCNSKASVSKIIRDFVTETWPRGPQIAPVSNYCQKDELAALVFLYSANFGADSFLTQGAALGLFGHHANTPQGIRNAIEHAMREGKIKLVICTSTLAQGVNLPIKYLFITNTLQGSDDLSPRDFHNLMGRAGRAGMHTEGTVIFTNPKLLGNIGTYYGRREWDATQRLLQPLSIGGIGSTLLDFLQPLKNIEGDIFFEGLTALEIATTLAQAGEIGYKLLEAKLLKNTDERFSSQNLIKQLATKWKTIQAVESYLMTHRESLNHSSFSDAAALLCEDTLAHFLSDVESRSLLSNVFSMVALRIDLMVPVIETQYRYGKTLLGLDQCMQIDAWVAQSSHVLLQISSVEEMLNFMWPLLTQLGPKIFFDVSNPHSLQALAKNWIEGKSFALMLLDLNGVTYSHGAQQRVFTIDKVVDLCEKAFGYEFCLTLSAVIDSSSCIILKDSKPELFNNLENLQRRLKCGLPDNSSLAIYEAGFTDRIIAQELSYACWNSVVDKNHVRDMSRIFENEMRDVLRKYPSFYSMILEEILS